MLVPSASVRIGARPMLHFYLRGTAKIETAWGCPAIGRRELAINEMHGWWPPYADHAWGRPRPAARRLWIKAPMASRMGIRIPRLPSSEIQPTSAAARPRLLERPPEVAAAFHVLHDVERR